MAFATAIAAGALALLAAGAPTGLNVVDGVYRFVFAGFLVLATSRANRWTWFVLAGAAGAVGSGDTVPLLLSCAALLLGFVSLRNDRRRREFGAAIGALSGQAFLWLPTDIGIALPLVAATAGTALVALSAVRHVRRPRRWLIGAGATVGIVVLIGATFTVAMLTIESHASDGVAAANRGLAAAGVGDDSASASAFAVAAREFASADTTAEAWWLAPARAVPVLAPHVEAARATAAEGQALAALGEDQAAVLDVRGLSRPTGGIDLDRVAELAPLASRVSGALGRAERALDDIDSPWLVSPVADRIDDFAAEVRSVAPTARNAADALDLAPTLLGADAQRTYLTLVGNPAEARELGGFVPSVGVLTADDGQLDFTSLEPISALNARVRESGRTLDVELPISFVGSAPERFVQNWTNTADFTVVSEVASQLGPAFAGDDVDGVLYLDPYVVAALLEIAGPVPIEGRARPLTADDAVDYLLRDQYLSDGFEEDGERKDRLRDAADAAFDQLTASTLPDPRRLANVLAPLVQARRLLFATTAPDAHPLLERVGLRPQLDGGAPDQILVTHENLRANKLDAYLERTISYDLDVDPDGRASGTVTVELTNRAPAEGLPAYVVGDGSPTPGPDGLAEALHRINLDLYSRLEPTNVAVDRQDTGFSLTTQGELFRTNTRIDLPPASTVTVVFELAGSLDPRRLALEIVPIAGATVDRVAANIDVSGVTRALRETAGDRTHRVEVGARSG